ncbi:hypothetical protein EDD15DRAFT_2194049 [Pisolithus albus]|nr:hypothetical protein EDD15DRAFT_2194049 [Pisolithus albus]
MIRETLILISRWQVQLTSRCVCRVSKWHCTHVCGEVFRDDKWWIVPVIALHSAAKFSLDVAEGLDGPSVGLHWQGRYFSRSKATKTRFKFDSFFSSSPRQSSFSRGPLFFSTLPISFFVVPESARTGTTLLHFGPAHVAFSCSWGGHENDRVGPHESSVELCDKESSGVSADSGRHESKLSLDYSANLLVDETVGDRLTSTRNSRCARTFSYNGIKLRTFRSLMAVVAWCNHSNGVTMRSYVRVVITDSRTGVNMLRDVAENRVAKLPPRGPVPSGIDDLSNWRSLPSVSVVKSILPIPCGVVRG